jgi:molecular chaperone IbpA
MKMRNYDLSPLYRSAIGFDRLSSLFDQALNTADSQPSYPPYNIELVDENSYRIVMAVAGFSDDEIDIEVEGDALKIVGSKQKSEDAPNYLHQGIAARNFERRFQLADHVKVTGAKLENGLLHVELIREIPEAMKPRKIEIAGSSQSKVIDGKAA